MKKLLYTAIIALAGLCAASCLQDHMDFVYDPSDVTPQTLMAFQGVTLEEDGPVISTSFNAADFGSGLASTYALYMSANQDMTDAVKCNATINADQGSISVAQKDLNTAILNFGGEAEQEFVLYFCLHSYLMNDKGSPIESTIIKSNVTATSFIAYNAELRDCDKYPVAYLPGGYQAKGDQGSGWIFTDEQYLYDYEGNGTYTGLLDVYESGAAGLDYGFKLTLEPTWDNGDFGAPQGATIESEPGTLALKRKPGEEDDNILCYDTYRFYMWSFNPAAQTLTKQYAFDNVGIVGSFNGWNQADSGMKMAYNKYYHRFWIDYTFDTDTELKFTCNDSWDLNWGVDCKPGGDNIPVKAGSYRVYLDLNKGNVEFSAKMFGQEEPGGTPVEPGPEPTYEGWGIIGSFNEWGGDAPMTEVGGVWTGYVNLTEADEWKLRKDAGWDENMGGKFTSLGTAFDAVAGGDNIKIGAAGFYKIVYDTNSQTITVFDGEVWSLIGGFNDWSGDVDMVLTDGKWVSPATQISGEFKIRHNHSWDQDRGGTLVTVGEPFKAEPGGANISVADGLWKVTYDPSAETILVEAGKPENLWSIIGAIGGTNWDTDFYMAKQADGTWMYEGIEIAEGNQFKIRYNNDWGVNRGATGDVEPFALTVGTAIEVVNNGKNLTGPVGKYDLIYDPAAETLKIVEQDKGWGVCGDYNGWGTTPDVQLIEKFPGIYVSEPVELTAGWKIRYNNGWDTNFGGPTPKAQGEFTQAVAGGDNINLAGKFAVVYNANNGTIGTIEWGVIGSIKSANLNWDGDIPMNLTSDGTYVSVPVALTPEDEFKIRDNLGWDVNRGGSCTEINTPFAVTNNGGNIKVPAAGTYVIVYNPKEEQIAISAAAVGLIGDFNSWGGDDFMLYAGQGKFYAFNRHYEGGWKIRMNADWAVNFGGNYVWGNPFAVAQDGPNISVTDAGVPAAGYNVIFDAVESTVTISQTIVIKFD